MSAHHQGRSTTMIAFALAALGVTVLLATPLAGNAYGATRLRDCAAQTIGAARVSGIETTGSCKAAARSLRALLAKGAAGLPTRKDRPSAWRCRKRSGRWACSRHRRGRLAERISFRVTEPTGPRECMALWNADAINASSHGIHFHLPPHNARQAWVFAYRDRSGLRRCAVIFVVPTTDFEYGSDGLVTGVPSGWIYIDDPKADLPDDRFVVQGRAPTNANASLAADGKLAALP